MYLNELEKRFQGVIERQAGIRKTWDKSGLGAGFATQIDTFGDTKIITRANGEIIFQKKGSAAEKVKQKASIGSKIRGLRSLSNL